MWAVPVCPLVAQCGAEGVSCPNFPQLGEQWLTLAAQGKEKPTYTKNVMSPIIRLSGQEQLQYTVPKILTSESWFRSQLKVNKQSL